MPTRQLARIGTLQAFGNLHAEPAVEVGPVVGNLACAVAEGHADRLENLLPMLVDVALLHQFAAIDGSEVGHVERVVGQTDASLGLADGLPLAEGSDDAPYYNKVLVALHERVDGRQAYSPMRNGLDDLPLVVDAHMVYLHTVGSVRHVGDGVAFGIDAEEQVARAQLATGAEGFQRLSLHAER